MVEMSEGQNASLGHARHGLTERWPLIIGGLGVVLAVVLGVEAILLVSAAPPIPNGYLAGVITSLPLIGWLVYGAYNLSAGDISTVRYDRIGGWSLIGMVAFAAFISVVSVASESMSWFGLVSTVRWASSVGGGMGLMIGLFDARALEGTFEAGKAWARQEETQQERDRLEEFASIVSHDLRNPHNVALGRLELARDECESDHLDDVEAALNRMESIIDDTLTLARQGQTVGETDPVDLAGVVRDCWAVVESGDATLDVGDLGTIQADRERLRHIFENLMRNAVEHGGDGVTIRIGRLQDRPGFFIEDDGPGIPEAQREAMFDPGEKSAAGGSGFGLAIVKRTVEAHGWDILATEGANGGARFEITGVDRPGA